MTITALAAPPAGEPPVPPAPSRGSALRWALADGLMIVRRELWHLKRDPGQLVGALVFPIALVVMFGYVFGSAITVPGGNYRAYLMPGLFSMASVFGVTVTAMAVATDESRGVVDRLRAMPVARLAVPFGQAGSDAVIGIMATLMMTGCGLVVGWRPHRGVAATLAGLGLVVLFRYALSWVGVYLGLAIRDERKLESYGPLIFPFTMIGNTFVPTGNMPGWLRVAADWNPVSAVTAATRQLFGNPAAAHAHQSLAMRHPVVATLLWCAALIGIFAPLAVRRYRRGPG